MCRRLLILSLFTSLCVLVSQRTTPADDVKAEPGFESLFNGKDLTGWQYKLGKDKFVSVDGKTATEDGRFEVVDGVIVAQAKDKAGKGGIKELYTTKNFDKDFILKMEIRASAKSDSGVYVRGPQLQVRDYPRLGQQKQLTKFKNDDWNELEIRVQAGKPSYFMNGEPITGGPEKIGAEGPIGIQAETGKFEFRNIRAKMARTQKGDR